MHYGQYFGFGWGVLMLLGMLIFWALVITGLVMLIRYLAAQTPATRPPTRETALDLLNRRLAMGEISSEEYDAARPRIEGGNRAE